MSGQLQLDLTSASAERRPVAQLAVLPGTEWEHIFGMPAPGDDADAPMARANTCDEEARRCT